MPGDLPGVDSNEDKEVWEYVCVRWRGGRESSLLWIPGMVHTGQMPGEWDKLENMRLNSENSVCINNNHLWWPLVLYLQGVHVAFNVCTWRICPNVYTTPIYSSVLPHPRTSSARPPFGLAVPHGWQLACGRALWGGRDPGCLVSVPASPSWDFTHFTVFANGWDCEWKHLKQCLVLQCQISGLHQWLDAA